MKKVLYVFGGEKASGAEIVIQRLLEYNLGQVEPSVFVSPGKFADELIASKKPYKVVTINRLRKLNRSNSLVIKFITEAIKNYFIISYKVCSYIKKYNIDIIHANTIVPASYLIPEILFSRIFFRKRNWIWSDHDLRYYSKTDKVFSAICASIYNKTIVVSEAVKKKYGNRKSVVVLHNGLNLNLFKANEEFRANFRNKNIFSRDDIVCSIAATISPRKGQLQLIEVFKQLLKESGNVKLVIAGGFGTDNPEYNNAVIEAIKGSKNIFYLGHVKNMIEFYCGSDVIINNSNAAGSEPLGTTIYEAMACEKIVIASNTGGSTEIISNNCDGFIFKAEDAENLRKTLEYVIINLHSLDEIRLMARKKAELKFDIRDMCEIYNNYI